MSRSLNVDILNLARAAGLNSGRRARAHSRNSLGSRRSGTRAVANSAAAAASSSADTTAASLRSRRRGRRRRGRPRRRTTRADNRSGKISTLNVHAREMPVLLGSIIRKTQNTQMPISTIGLRRSRDRASNLLQPIGTSRMVKLDRARVEINSIRNIMPSIGGQLGVPLRLSVHEPLQAFVRGALRAGDEAVFHFREVAFEEVDLVLAGS